MAGGDGSALTQFDFSAIDELDPALANGSTVIYDREVPFELRVQTGAEGPGDVGTLEAVRVKIVALGEVGRAQPFVSACPAVLDASPSSPRPPGADRPPFRVLAPLPATPRTIAQGSGLVSVTAELTSENDIFFHHSHTLDARGFRTVQDQQARAREPRTICEFALLRRARAPVFAR
jgi:hypothetical protein